MKPNFALNLTHESIGLLHRTARGWLEVGSAALETPDLGEALTYLRRSALGLAPHGVSSKLVIPNSQILYLSVEAPGPDAEARRAQIAKSLEGRTPYPVSELVFDWSGEGPQVKVAVVARETLAEAEQFAAQYRFNPVSFVAIPEAGTFDGEPFFGPSATAASLLPAGESVEPDGSPITIVSREAARAEQPVPVVSPVLSTDWPEPAQLPEPEPVPEPEPEPEPEPGPEPEPEPMPEEDPRPGPEWEPPMDPEAEPEPLGEPPQTDPLGEPEPLAEPLPIEVPPPYDIPPDMMPEMDATPTGTVPQAATTPSVLQDGLAEAPGETGGAASGDDLPPAPAFSTRRNPETGAATVLRATGPAARPASPSAPPRLRPGEAAGTRTAGRGAPKPQAAKGLNGLVTAPGIPGLRPRKATPIPMTTPAPEAEPHIPAAKPAATKPPVNLRNAPPRGKPKHLGLILTGLLLLALALVAAWSSFYLASSRTTEAIEVAAAPAEPAATPEPADVPAATAPDEASALPPVEEVPVEDEALADLQDPAAMTVTTPAPEETAAAEAPASEAPVVEAAVQGPAPAAPGSADSPALAAGPGTLPEILLAAPDAPPATLDTLALPAATTDAEPLPAAQVAPPPFGTMYEFDERGLIKPTAEGIVTPEGVRLVAGRPPVVPPARPEGLAPAPAAAATAEAAEATTADEAAAPFPSDPALAGFRPRPRPEGLVPPATLPAETAPTEAAPAEDQGTAVTIPEASRMTSLRPQPRPASVVALGEAARAATEAASLSASAAASTATEPQKEDAAITAPVSKLAVAISRRPPARPKDFSAAVEAAVAAAVRQPDPQPEPEPQAKPEPEPEPEPAPAKRAEPEADEEPEVAEGRAPPAIIGGSVAKNATFVNAINLRETNLIGIYGTSSKRYALIRTATGQYKKVKVGDRVDGGTVAAITDSELRYQKGSRMLALEMP